MHGFIFCWRSFPLRGNDHFCVDPAGLFAGKPRSYRSGPVFTDPVGARLAREGIISLSPIKRQAQYMAHFQPGQPRAR
ncbi:hypothetical protein C9I49_25555 [Pseudomonas prosekii]|uniref:Uncharacterized protein n=1 Tax=Pseudomonas prosekii TaxID=1148509 RepID=A0A2U2D1C4_9PSED|nr:hypothetical protein C9I49_25555 [Pseudomonas prosekii]